MNNKETLENILHLNTDMIKIMSKDCTFWPILFSCYQTEREISSCDTHVHFNFHFIQIVCLHDTPKNISTTK